ncbi:MAG: pantetheine-phosphate adenylyltransferase [Ilumatobacteraceae bacterium]
MSTVLNPGSFDPIHLGHLDVLEQAVELFGHVTVVVMHNHEKPGGLFDVEERQQLIRRSLDDDGIGASISVTAHAGLAIDAATEAGASFIVKGLRSPADFEIEQQMALTNHSVTGIRTVYLPCRADRGYISSRFVREIARYGGAVGHMVPKAVADALATKFAPGTARS